MSTCGCPAGLRWGTALSCLQEYTGSHTCAPANSVADKDVGTTCGADAFGGYNGSMRSVPAILLRTPVFLVVCAIRFYQVALRPMLTGSCKFIPSCSDYFIEAVQEWGAIRGSVLGLRRILRCHPFGKGGFDPVPPHRSDGS